MSHRDVMANVAFGLEVKGVDKASREEKAQELINMVGLNGLEHASIQSYLRNVSKSRKTSFANNPDILLMDEPFSALILWFVKRCNLNYGFAEKLKKTVVFITAILMKHLNY